MGSWRFIILFSVFGITQNKELIKKKRADKRGENINGHQNVKSYDPRDKAAITFSPLTCSVLPFFSLCFQLLHGLRFLIQFLIPFGTPFLVVGCYLGKEKYVGWCFLLTANDNILYTLTIIQFSSGNLYRLQKLKLVQGKRASSSGQRGQSIKSAPVLPA